MQCTGSRDDGHHPFETNFSGILSGRSRGACLPNLKFVSLAVLELLAFNAQRFKESRDPDHAPFYPFLTLRVWRLPKVIHLQSVQRQRQRSVSTLPLKMHYVGANLGEIG